MGHASARYGPAMMPARQSQAWKRRDAPLLSNSPPGQDWFRCGFYCPRVIYAKGRFRMWFVGSDSPSIEYKGSSLGYAESADGVEWQRRDELVGIDVGEDGWDSEMIAYPCVVVHGDREYMFYNGNGFGRSGFGYATRRRSRETREG